MRSSDKDEGNLPKLFLGFNHQMFHRIYNVDHDKRFISR